MATQNITSALWEDLNPTNFTSRPLPYLVTAILFVLAIYNLRGTKSNVYLYNPKKTFEFTTTRLKEDFDINAHKMLHDWFSENPEKPVRFNSDTGLVTVLPPRFAGEVRNDESFSLFRFLDRAYHTHLPGFDGFREVCQEAHLVNTVIQNDLSKYVNKVTLPVSAETETVIAEVFTNSKEWHTVQLHESVLRIVARVTSKVFLGDKLCRNEAWLKVSQAHAVTVFTAAYKLRLWPAFLRPIIHWFLPWCRQSRAEVKEAHEIMQPVLKERQEMKAMALAQGKRAPQFDDAIEWFEKTAKGRKYDPVGAQLAMSFSAIYTTTDLICQTITNIAQHPDIIEPLRQEIRTVLADGGWKSSSLYNMKLLDSVMKECQRLKPIESALMRSTAIRDVELSDGTLIPKGEVVAVSSHRMWDSNVYEKADQWDGYRFLRMREQPGQEAAAQLANTSTEQYGFGLGRRSCPGRFFASNSAKIILAHVLLKYDWKLTPNQEPPQAVFRAFGIRADPRTTIDVQRRADQVRIL